MLDNRDWEGLSRIFVDEATFEIPGEVLQGLEGIREFMRAAKHPRTHLMTNVYVAAYRHPLETAKAFATVDALMEGASAGDMTMGELKTHGDFGLGTPRFALGGLEKSAAATRQRDEDDGADEIQTNSTRHPRTFGELP